MLRYLDANELMQPMATGFQLGLGLAHARNQGAQLAEERRHAMAQEALGQQELSLKQQEASRVAQEFNQAQQAQQFIGQRFKEEQAKDMAAPVPSDQASPYDLGAQAQQKRTPQQIFNDLLPEVYARYPVNVAEKILPLMQRQVITPFQAQGLDIRRESNAIRSGRNAVLEDQGEERLAQGQTRNEIAQGRLSAQKLSTIRQLQTQTGENIVDPVSGNVDLDAYDRAMSKAGQSFTFNKQMTPAERQAQRVLDSDPYYKTNPDSAEAARAALVANGGKPPPLTVKDDQDLEKSDMTVRGAEKLLDAAKKYEGAGGQFGPLFGGKALLGKITGGEQAVRDMKQVYDSVSTGKAFEFGGKTLTKNEIDAILSQIGTPSQADFKARSAEFLQAETEKLNRFVQNARDRGATLNPSVRRRVEIYQQNLDRLRTKLEGEGRPESEAFGNQGGEGGTYDVNGVKVKVTRVK